VRGTFSCLQDFQFGRSQDGHAPCHSFQIIEQANVVNTVMSAKYGRVDAPADVCQRRRFVHYGASHTKTGCLDLIGRQPFCSKKRINNVTKTAKRRRWKRSDIDLARSHRISLEQSE
jgi:hypothetical protein